MNAHLSSVMDRTLMGFAVLLAALPMVAIAVGGSI